MADLGQRVYNSFPALRSVLATAKGYQIHRQRYGKVYRQTLQQIEERRNWTLHDFRAYQNSRFLEILKVAAHHVPYYREASRHNACLPRISIP